MPRTLRRAGLIALAIAIPVVVASATYAIGVRSLAPTTRLQVNVANQTPGDSPSSGRTSDDHGGSTAGQDGASGGADDHGGTSKGTSDGSGSTPGGGSSPTGEDHHGGSSGSDDGGKSGSGSGGGGSGDSGSGGSGGSGSDSHGGGGDD
jgi:hypothetical protein